MIVATEAADVGRELPGGRVAIGNFDGLHAGHVRVLSHLGERSVVMSFRPHPAEVLGRTAPPRLQSDPQLGELLARMGVQVLLLQRFDREFAAITAEEFAERILVEEIGACAIVVGTAFRFGRGARGTVATLRERLEPKGVEVVAVEPVMRGGEPISSTRIRRLVADGDVVAAAELLDRPYVLEGIVVEGDRRGRSLGFPTANLDAPGRAIPGAGVYAAFAAWDEATWQAVVNVGVRPTFGGDPAPRAEVHVLGEPGDLYGRTLRVAFVERLREERRFAGPAELVAQIRQDAADARERLDRIDGASLRGPGF